MIIILGGGVIFALIIVGLRYQTSQKQVAFSQLPTEKAEQPPLQEEKLPVGLENWQIFINREYDFSFYYPTDWLVSQSQSPPSGLVIKVFPQRWQGQQEPWATSANIEVSSQQEEVFSNDSEVEAIEFAGQSCQQVTSKLPQTGGFGPQIICIKNGLSYKLQVFAYYKTAGEPETAQQILETFRFLIKEGKRKRQGVKKITGSMRGSS